MGFDPRARGYDPDACAIRRGQFPTLGEFIASKHQQVAVDLRDRYRGDPRHPERCRHRRADLAN